MKIRHKIEFDHILVWWVLIVHLIYLKFIQGPRLSCHFLKWPSATVLQVFWRSSKEILKKKKKSEETGQAEGKRSGRSNKNCSRWTVSVLKKQKKNKQRPETGTERIIWSVSRSSYASLKPHQIWSAFNPVLLFLIYFYKEIRGGSKLLHSTVTYICTEYIKIKNSTHNNDAIFYRFNLTFVIYTLKFLNFLFFTVYEIQQKQVQMPHKHPVTYVRGKMWTEKSTDSFIGYISLKWNSSGNRRPAALNIGGVIHEDSMYIHLTICLSETCFHHCFSTFDLRRDDAEVVHCAPCGRLRYIKKPRSRVGSGLDNRIWTARK